MEFDPVSARRIGAAIEVHRQLGPGLLEAAYAKCLAYELRRVGLRVEHQKPVPLIYKGWELIHYLKLSGHPIGLLINFNVKLLRTGIRRFVN